MKVLISFLRGLVFKMGLIWRKKGGTLAEN